MTFYFLADKFGKPAGYLFTGLLEGSNYKWHPFFFRDFLQEEDLTKTIEGRVRVVEDVHHHVTLAAIQTIVGMVLMLPYGAHRCFHLLPAWKIGQLLEFIDTYDDMQTLIDKWRNYYNNELK